MKFSLFILMVCLLLSGCKEQSRTPETEAPNAHLLLGYDRTTGERKFRTEVGTLTFLFDGPGLAREGRLYFVSGETDQMVLMSADTQTGQVQQSEFLPSATSTEARAIPFLLRRGLLPDFDPSNGELPGLPEIAGVPLALQGTNLYCATADQVIAYETGSWKERWRVKMAGASHLAASDDSEVAVVNPNGCRYFSSEGKELWKVDTPFQPSGVALSDGAVLVGTAKPKLWALDRKSGKKLWEHSWEGGANGWARPRVVGPIVAFPVGSNLEAFDVSSGEKKWTFEGVGSAVGADPTAAQFFIISNDRLNLSCVDASSGETVWTKKSETPLVGPPSFDSEGVYLFGVADAASPGAQ